MEGTGRVVLTTEKGQEAWQGPSSGTATCRRARRALLGTLRRPGRLDHTGRAPLAEARPPRRRDTHTPQAEHPQGRCARGAMG